MYATLGVSEIWQYDGKVLTLLELVGDRYVKIERSLAFPRIRAKAIEQFLSKSMVKDYLELVSKFRQRLRKL